MPRYDEFDLDLQSTKVSSDQGDVGVNSYTDVTGYSYCYCSGSSGGTGDQHGVH